MQNSEVKRGDELEMLEVLADNNDSKQFGIGMPDPFEAIKLRMEQMEDAVEIAR